MIRSCLQAHSRSHNDNNCWSNVVIINGSCSSDINLNYQGWGEMQKTKTVCIAKQIVEVSNGKITEVSGFEPQNKGSFEGLNRGTRGGLRV